MSPKTEIQARPLGPTLLRLALVVGAAVLAVHLLGAGRAVGLIADAVVVVFLAYLVRHLLFLAAALGGPSRHPDTDLGPDVDLSATVVLPCHDEAAVVDALIASVAALEPPGGGLQVVFVDDRSTDATPARLDEAVAAHPGWSVIHRPADAAPGKSAALNDALAVATGEVVVVFDADHQPRPDCVRRLVRHFTDREVAAAQGRCIVRNPSESPLARLLALDYLCGYLVNMVGRDRVFGLPAYGGANCAVRTETVRRLGGWNERSVTEDTDITIRVLLDGGVVRYDPTAIDTEQAVSTLPRYWRQRYRWARGHQQVCADHLPAVLATRRLSALRKLETILFLFSFHVPVVCLVAALLVAARLGGAIGVEQSVDPWPLIPLMLGAPLLEIGGGLILAGVRRRRALDLVLFPVLYVVSMAVCTKALLDRLLGRRYGWRKTTRSTHALAAASRPAAPAPAAVGSSS